MGDLITLPTARRDHIPLAIDILPVPLNSLAGMIVYANSDLELSDQRSFTSIRKAMIYAAALSAKYGCPIVPHGAAAQFFGESLCE